MHALRYNGFSRGYYAIHCTFVLVLAMSQRQRRHPDNEVDFLLSIPRFVTEAFVHKETLDLNLAEYYRDTADSYGRPVLALSLAAADFLARTRPNDAYEDLSGLLDSLLCYILAIREHFRERASDISASSLNTNRNFLQMQVQAPAAREIGQPNQRPTHVGPGPGRSVGRSLRRIPSQIS